MTAAAASQSASQPLRDTLSRIVMAGLAGGAVDFFYASGSALIKGAPVSRPWQSVASGWIGRAAAEGGPGVTALGLVTHFGIALCMAAAYVLAARRVPIVVQRPWATAPLYGLILYAVMYMGVLPLRFHLPVLRWSGMTSVFDILAHVGVALAIVAVVARRRPQ
jgi:hypothetical protein